MDSTGSGAFAYTFPAVDSPFRFSVAAGDARSQTIEIAVDKRPRLESMAVTYQYPPYCGLTNYTIEDFDGHLHGLPGTTALLTFRTNKPLNQLTINRNNGQVISGKVLDGQSLPSTQWQAALTLTEAGTYRIQLKDNQGYEVEIPTTFTISLERDGPPAVALAKPGRDLQQRPDSSVDFVKNQGAHSGGFIRALRGGHRNGQGQTR